MRVLVMGCERRMVRELPSGFRSKDLSDWMSILRKRKLVWKEVMALTLLSSEVLVMKRFSLRRRAL